MDSEPKKLVIVGGGIGGLMLATRLGRRYRRSRSLEVTLVDRAAVHVWKPMLHSFAAGTANPNYDGLPFIAQAKRAGFVYLPGEFIGIDTSQQTISLKLDRIPGTLDLQKEVPYDYAVMALGSGANDFGTPGVNEHCFFIDTLWNAEALNSRVRTELIHAIATDQKVNIAIVGAGATGVEFAADLASLVNIGESYGARNLSQQLNITLINSESRILPAFSEQIAQRVTESLQDLGVEVICDAFVSSVEPNCLVLKNGDTIKASVKVWTAGVTAIVASDVFADFESSRGGQLIVNERLETKINANVFALGDCASFTPHHSDKPLPPTGQVARQQADFLFELITQKIDGKPLPEFRFREMGSLVSLSQFGAHVELSRIGFVPAIALEGWVAKRLHRLFYRMHQFGLFGPLSGVVVMLRDALDGMVRPSIRMD